MEIIEVIHETPVKSIVVGDTILDPTGTRRIVVEHRIERFTGVDGAAERESVEITTILLDGTECGVQRDWYPVKSDRPGDGGHYRLNVLREAK